MADFEKVKALVAADIDGDTFKRRLQEAMGPNPSRKDMDKLHNILNHNLSAWRRTHKKERKQRVEVALIYIHEQVRWAFDDDQLADAVVQFIATRQRSQLLGPQQKVKPQT